MPDFDRELLEAWDDPEVPSGFADRVVTAGAVANRLDAAPRPWSVYVAVAALIVVGASILFVRHAAPPSATQGAVEASAPMAVLSGDAMGAPPPIQCTGPDEVDLADRGRATLRGSAVLEWTLDDEARLNVHQRAGRVQYDLSAGEKVLLTTPRADDAMELEGRFEVDLEVGDDEAILAY